MAPIPTVWPRSFEGSFGLLAAVAVGIGGRRRGYASLGVILGICGSGTAVAQESELGHAEPEPPVSAELSEACGAACSVLVACGVEAPFPTDSQASCALGCLGSAATEDVTASPECDAALIASLRCLGERTCEELAQQPPPGCEGLGQAVGRACMPLSAASRLQQLSLDQIAAALDRIRRQYGEYPAGLDLLTVGLPDIPYVLEGPFVDRWGRPLAYQPEDAGPGLRSLGPDGIEGTDDDIVPGEAPDTSAEPPSAPVERPRGGIDASRGAAPSLIGAASGSERRFQCPQGQVGVGLRAPREDALDQVELVCAPVGGQPAEDEQVDASLVRTCPEGSALMGVHLSDEDPIGAIVGACAVLRESRPGLGLPDRYLFPFGRPRAMTEWGWRHCERGQYLIGLSLWSDDGGVRGAEARCGDFDADWVTLLGDAPDCLGVLGRTAAGSPLLHARLSLPDGSGLLRVERFAADPESPGRFSRRLMIRGGASPSGQDSLECTPEALLWYGAEYGDGRGRESFDPPLPLLRFPLQGGDSWEWSGTWHFEVEGASVSYPTRVVATIGAAEEREVGLRTRWVHPLELRFEAAGTAWRQVDWLTLAPMFVLAGRDVYASAEPDALPIERWGPPPHPAFDTPRLSVAEPESEGEGRLRTQSVGAATGVVFTRSCPQGSWVTGLVGRATDDRVTALAPRCSGLSEPLPEVGGSAGERFELFCPNGGRIQGLRGLYDDTLRSLSAVCASSPDESIALGAVGGARGVPFTRTCPRSMVANGLEGHATDAIQELVLVCAEEE